MGLARVGEELRLLGLPPDVVATIQNARAPSTRSAYNLRWKIFEEWCTTLVPPVVAWCAPLNVILTFLQERVAQKLSFSTVKVYLAAISACHKGFDGRTVGQQALVRAFMEGASNTLPNNRSLFPKWDLTVVLGALCRTPFEPLESVSLQILSLKTLLLLALATTKRVSDLQALSVSPDLMRFYDNGRKVLLKPHHGFMPKNRVVPQLPVELLAFHPPPFSSAEEERLHCLCPVRALRIYCQKTSAERITNQLFVSYGNSRQRKAVTRPTLSRWIVDAIRMAYSSANVQVPDGLKAHSTRGVASSWAVSRGASLQEICTAASWSSPSTFATFYSLDVAPNSVAHLVLGAAGPSR